MRPLALATTSVGKSRELRALLAPLKLDVRGAADLGLEIAVEETGATFRENAVLKALAFARAAEMPALGDDSGLEVDALDGFPGVRSSRWVDGTDEDRVSALLARLAGVPPERRAARFRTVAAVAWPDGRCLTASGRVEGRIALEPRGAGGFGYDPVFLVEDGGYSGEVTMAELVPDEKNRLSHRARAIRALMPLVLPMLGAESGG